MHEKLLSVVAVLCIVTGCASTETIDEFEAPEADVAGRRGFAIKGGDFGIAVAPDPKLVEQADQRLRALIAEELLQKGYRQVGMQESADMVVSYQVAGHRQFVISDERRIGAPSANQVLTPGGASNVPVAGSVPKEQTVRHGSVIVFVEDPKTGKLIWRGAISTEERVTSTEAATRKVEAYTRQIVHEFPVHRP
jgi:hypothetical protein